MKSLVVSALLSSLAIVGCTIKPLDGDTVNAREVDFGGFALEANQAITIEGFDHRTNAWVAFATATSGTTVNMHWGEHDWYSWNKAAVNTLNPGNNCFWGAWNATSQRCLLSPGGDSARFRVRGGGFDFLSYQEGFIDCITEETNGGEPQSRAALTCRSPNSPEIVLSIIN
jgi:hypothetical protein